MAVEELVALAPSIGRLELDVDDPVVTLDELAGVLRAAPQVAELALSGDGFAGIGAYLGELPYPPGLSLVVDAVVELPAALALAESPGTLAQLGALEFHAASPDARLVLLVLERAVPLASNGHRLAVVARWAQVELGCAGPIDRSLRVWQWQTGEEGRSSGWVVFLPDPADAREADLLHAGSATVYADWLEERGEVAHANEIRMAGMPFRPRTLPEAIVFLACAWERISGDDYIRERVPGAIDPLDPGDLAELVARYAQDEHPLEPTAARTIPPSRFDDLVHGLVSMMREHTPATLRENRWRVRDDVLAFTPPIGAAREAIALADRWNDRFVGAETELGYALMIWGTGA